MGAALGTVGGSSDLVVNLEPIKAQLKESGEGEGCEEAELEQKAREVALKRGREAARNEAIAKKGKYPVMWLPALKGIGTATFLSR